MFTEAPVPQLELTKSFGHHTFKDEGDPFSRKRIKGMHVHRSLNTTPENRIGPIPMCDAGAFGESICINHSVGSLGLNLTCEGYCWGCRKEATRKPP
jgi:hypothetical protein